MNNKLKIRLCRPGGGTGRRASLRGWFSQGSAGSIPVPGSGSRQQMAKNHLLPACNCGFNASQKPNRQKYNNGI